MDLKSNKFSFARSLLNDVSKLVGIAGWLVFISGAIMLFLQNGGMFFSFSMQLSIMLFILIQIFDHFWADNQEDELQDNSQASANSLKIWLIVKFGLYVIITLLMVLKP